MYKAIVACYGLFCFQTMTMLKYLTPVLLFVTIACDTSEPTKPLIYEGPIREMQDIEINHTESGIIKMKMKAPAYQLFLNNDEAFPAGINLEFYDEEGNLSSTLHANEAFYDKAKDEWQGKGNVELKNIQKNEQLNTEELFWKPREEKIYTDKFVTIRQQNDVIYGEGLDAKQDLSDYRIHKVSGTLEIKE